VLQHHPLFIEGELKPSRVESWNETIERRDMIQADGIPPT
jgi:hypothetical protein